MTAHAFHAFHSSRARVAAGSRLLICAMALATAAQGADRGPTAACPPFPLPKNVTLQPVAQNVDFSGLPLSIERFDTTAMPNDVLAFYRAAWAKTEALPGPIEYPLGAWRVIATFRGACFYTVQVMPGGKKGATGFLAISAAPSKNVVKAEVPTMTGSTILNDIAHNDPGKPARTVMLSNGFSPAANATFYKNVFTGQGWEIVSNAAVSSRTARGNVMVLRNGMRELSITTAREGGDTQVLLNFVDNP